MITAYMITEIPTEDGFWVTILPFTSTERALEYGVLSYLKART